MSIKNNRQKLKQEFQDRNKVAELGGGKKRIADQHKKGKFTARERIEQLCDPGSFMEFDKFGTHKCQNFGLADQKFYGDGVVTGFANIDGRRICIFAQDFTVFGGALSEHHAYKICKMMDQAANLGCPVIGLCDSGGARIQEGVESLAGYADIFLRNTMYSGVVPQISVILGPCAGGAVYSPAITDFVIMAEGTSHMFITGPEVIKTVTRENVDKETLGGAKAHMEKSGVTHFVANNEQEALGICKKLLSYLPQNSQSKTTKIRNEDPIDRKNIKIDEIIPDDENKPYDMLSIISEIADTNSLTQVQEGFAQNIITAFVRLNGRSVGVVANQPKHLAGCLDIDASCKAARFVRFCNAFNIPILTLVDVPGFLPGVRQEHGGIIRHGAKLLFAFAEATVPKVTIVVRKAYGGAYDVMSSKHLRGDVNLAYPIAEIAVMGSQGAVAIIHKKELEEAEAKGKFDEVKQQLIDEYKKRFSNPWVAAELGFIDAIILPEDTRHELIKAFDFLENKKVENIVRRNSNIPL